MTSLVFSKTALRLFVGVIAATSVSAFAAEATLPPAPKWESTAALGLTLTKGNSDTLLFNANVVSIKKWDLNSLTLGADGTYGENNNVKNNEAFRAYGQYNHGISDRLFAFGRLEGLHDGIADVEYRVTLSAGLGYYLIKNEKFELSTEAGPGYVFEKRGVQERNYATLRLAETFKWKITDKSRLWQSLEILPEVENFGNYVVNAEIGLETAITEKLGLRVTALDNYVSKPAPGRKANDVKLITSLTYKF